MADPNPDGGVSLRPWRAADATELVAAWNDPDVQAGSNPPPDRSLAAARRWIDGCAVREDRLLAIDRVIDVDGRCVGEVGISDIDDRRGAALIGWWVGADHRGHGYAAAGVAEMASWLLDPAHRAGIRALVAQIGVANSASVRVAERAGFSLLRAGDEDHHHVYVRR